MVLVGMMEQVRRFSSDDVTLTDIMVLTLLTIPEALYGILPLMVILATLTLFLNLARTSELVVTRASGRSALRSLIAPLIVAFLIGCTAVAVFNPIVAGTAKLYEVMSNRIAQTGDSVLSITREGVWLRQGGQEGQTVIRAAQADLEGAKLSQATFIGFGLDGVPAFRIEAAEAELLDGGWQIRDAKEWRFRVGGNPERDATLHDTFFLASELSRDELRDSFGTPSSIPIWELPAFINRLERAGFSAQKHRVWLQMEMALPLILVAMVFLGAAFTLRHTRFGRTGLMILFALLLGFALYFLRNFAQVLGENGQIPIALAAWAPPVAAICLSLGLLLHLEDG
jgi:lipopolysaccharide export system permease protein